MHFNTLFIIIFYENIPVYPLFKFYKFKAFMIFSAAIQKLALLMILSSYLN